MRISYIRLENFAVIYVGQQKDYIEIEFPKSGNKIVSIQGSNGSAKSGLISQLTPFAYPTSIDERSSLSTIREGHNGYKEIHYEKEDKEYIIKHYYKASKNTHSVKSYIALNGKELNENGNVSSFNYLIQIHFGLTQDMMRLLRMGSNVNSFISLTPAKRKEYIGSLIDEIDIYMKIYKKINDDLKVLKVLKTSNTNNLYNCHIADISMEEENLSELKKRIKENEKNKEELVKKLDRIYSLERENNIDELKRRQKELESSIYEFDKTSSMIKENGLSNTSLEDLINKRHIRTADKVDIQSKINSYRLTIDTLLQNIERLQISIQKISSDHDLDTLIQLIKELKNSIQISEKNMKTFHSEITYDELSSILYKFQSYNTISQQLYSFGKKPISLYLKLIYEKKSVDQFLKNQKKQLESSLHDMDIKRLMDQLFGEDQIITPNCTDEFRECPYYRFSEILDQLHEKLSNEYDAETLRYLQIISNHMDAMLNDFDQIKGKGIPDSLIELITEKTILRRLEKNLPLIELQPFQNYLGLVKEYENLMNNKEKLKQYEQQLLIYKKSGMENQWKEIQQHKDSIEFYKRNIDTLSKELDGISKDIRTLEVHIGLLSKYQEEKKYQKMTKESLEDTNKLLIPLENATKEKSEFQFKLQHMQSLILSEQEQYTSLEFKIKEYKRLLGEEKVLAKKHHDLSLILESVSTKKGIPVLYMKTYLGRIQKLSNDLLSIIYQGTFKLSSFKVTQETFEIPYVKNGNKIPDVRYASQSEIPLATMALSFALSNRASSSYNIILLDEMDAGFDEHNRHAFLKMLSEQIRLLKAEQVFIISHNINNIIDIPIDVIKMSDNVPISKLQNIIYE